MMSCCSCRQCSISNSMGFNHRPHFVRNQVFEGQFIEICHLVPKHHARVAPPTHATSHTSHFLRRPCYRRGTGTWVCCCCCCCFSWRRRVCAAGPGGLWTEETRLPC